MTSWITRLTQKIESWASKTKLGYWITSHYYQDVIQKEVDLAAVTATDHILFIGGGICPCSAILLHRTTGAKVTVIDHDMSCISKAQQVIKRLNLNEYVHVLHQDGGDANLALSNYSIIHFALQVSPLEHVFSQMITRATPGTKLLVRRPKKRLNKIYSQLSHSLPDGCNYITHKRARNIGKTLLYIKKEGVLV